MTTAARDYLSKIPVIGDDEVCHIIYLPTDLRTYCGAPCNCPPVAGGGIDLPPWTLGGPTTCCDCGRPLCPECMALCARAAGGPPP